MEDVKATLLHKIASRQACVGVVGLGYVGLPLAVEFAKAGFKVIGVDVDLRKVDALNAGRSYIPDVKTEDVADYHDPYVPVLCLDGGVFQSVALSREAASAADCIAIITEHSTFDWDMIAQHARLIVDTRNALKHASNGRARVVRL